MFKVVESVVTPKGRIGGNLDVARVTKAQSDVAQTETRGLDPNGYM